MTSCARAVAAALIFLLAAVRPALAGPVILLEAQTGRVLYAEDQDHEWFPASLTKIMTAYLVFEALKGGRLKLDDTVKVSQNAHLQPPSKLGLPVGGEISVDLALRVLIVKSANDVAVMLAEKIAGTEEDFARLMNEKAERLGMTRTHFVNANGLPAPGQISTARDLARLARAIITDFPEHNAMWSLPQVRVGKQRLKSHNALLRSFDGADGIKTGFICDSGFNVVASATRDDRRLIAVVLGEPSGDDRNIRAAALLDHGFETADWKAHLGVPTVDTLPLDPSAQAVQSVRTSVVAWNCGNRKVRKVVRRKPSVTRKIAKESTATEAAGSADASPPPIPTRKTSTGRSGPRPAKQ